MIELKAKLRDWDWCVVDTPCAGERFQRHQRCESCECACREDCQLFVCDGTEERGRVPKICSKEQIALETNIACTASLDVGSIFPKHVGTLCVDVMPCPLLFAAQQLPNIPSLFAVHNFRSMALRTLTSSAAAHPRTIERSRKEKKEKECFIACLEKNELNHRRKRKGRIEDR